MSSNRPNQVWVHVNEVKLPPVRAYVTVVEQPPVKQKPAYVYVDTFEPLSDDRYTEHQLHLAKDELKSWLKKYSGLGKHCPWIKKLSRSLNRAIE